MRPGTYPRVAGLPVPTDWALEDIHPLSHEIAEWADDPFVDNWVEPWATPTAPQYGCTNTIETGGASVRTTVLLTPERVDEAAKRPVELPAAGRLSQRP